MERVTPKYSAMYDGVTTLPSTSPPLHQPEEHQHAKLAFRQAQLCQRHVHAPLDVVGKPQQQQAGAGVRLIRVAAGPFSSSARDAAASRAPGCPRRRPPAPAASRDARRAAIRVRRGGARRVCRAGAGGGRRLCAESCRWIGEGVRHRKIIRHTNNTVYV
ncbi:hypothetical protein BUH_6463 [Burkholderia pseudomallei Pakistan 9]|nr:hypothetical protein BUH_6463 [Burkholderia pseudomallei Pakistan 9]